MICNANPSRDRGAFAGRSAISRATRRRAQRPNPAIYERDHLASLRGLPIASSRLADGRRLPATLEDLREHRLLRARDAPDLRADWLTGVGASPAQFRFAEVDNTHLVYEGAAGGIGVAIAVLRLDADLVVCGIMASGGEAKWAQSEPLRLIATNGVGTATGTFSRSHETSLHERYKCS